MRIETEIKLDFKDVLFRPKRSTLGSRREVTLERTFEFKNAKRIDEDPSKVFEHPNNKVEWRGVPIMTANMDGVGTIEMARALMQQRMFTCLTKFIPLEEITELFEELNDDTAQFVAYSLGISKDDYANYLLARDAIGDKLRYVCIDVANGYSEGFTAFVKKFRKENPTKVIIAGNVVTGEMVEELLIAGADIVKVGIGPGAVCTTRIQTGVGYPQLSAIMECADAAHGLNGHIIADGGCTNPGDIAKAFGAGADFVMLGSMLAGHDEGGGAVINKRYRSMLQNSGVDTLYNKPIVEFYGMSSEEAMNKHSGGMASYRSSEGRIVEVPYKGKVSDTINNILGGLRSTCTYIGAPELSKLSKCTTFIRTSQQYNSAFED